MVKNYTKADGLFLVLFTPVFVSIFFVLVFPLELSRQLFYSFVKVRLGICCFV